MNDHNLQADPRAHPHQRRRRRRGDFLNTLQQSRYAGDVPRVNVGQRLREQRMDRGLTIRDLAQKSGLNVNTLSMIENGKASPSIETLQQLSYALEMPIVAFFEDTTPEREIVHHKACQRPVFSFAHGILEDLGAGMSRRGAETLLVMLNPHSDSGENPIVHTGRETVYCLEGKITYIVDDQTFVLEPGDSLLFEAHLPHRMQNTGAIPTRALIVLCPSDEQDSPTERHFTLEVFQKEEA